MLNEHINELAVFIYAQLLFTQGEIVVKDTN